MLSGMANGSTYNSAGIQAAPGEKTVPVDQLQQLLIDVARPSYNLDSVNAMLTGMDEGKSYNVGGQAAGIGEWTWTYDLLEQLLIDFLDQSKNIKIPLYVLINDNSNGVQACSCL